MVSNRKAPDIAVLQRGLFLTSCHPNQPICVITRCADTGRVPPARGVMVSAAALPSGLRTVRTELVDVVVTTAIPTICDVPVARPATV